MLVLFILVHECLVSLLRTNSLSQTLPLIQEPSPALLRTCLSQI